MSLKITKEISLLTTGTIELDLSLPIEQYIITGTPTLTGNVNVVTTGTPKEGLTVNIMYLATPIIGANTITILGANINTIATKPSMFKAIYINSNWRVVYTNFNNVDPTNTPLVAASIASDAIITEKLIDEAVTLPKLIGTMLDIPVTYLYDSNTAAKNTRASIFVPFKFQIINIGVSCVEAMNTEELEYDLAINSTTSVYNSIISTSVAAGSSYIEPLGDLSIYKSTGASYLRFFPTKTTTGGMALFTFHLRRIP